MIFLFGCITINQKECIDTFHDGLNRNINSHFGINSVAFFLTLLLIKSVIRSYVMPGFVRHSGDAKALPARHETIPDFRSYHEGVVTQQLI